MYEEDFLWTMIEGEDTLKILVLDSIQDPHNLGACLRNANVSGWMR